MVDASTLQPACLAACRAYSFVHEHWGMQEARGAVQVTCLELADGNFYGHKTSPDQFRGFDLSQLIISSSLPITVLLQLLWIRFPNRFMVMLGPLWGFGKIAAIVWQAGML